MTLILLIFLYLLFYYIFFIQSLWRGVRNNDSPKNSLSVNEFVSIIIPYRNEKENLIKSLTSISNQSFPRDRYEVLYVDDNSDDNGTKILRESINQDNIKVLHSPFKDSERAHKKKALQYAIEQAKGEIIITTDADCRHGIHWLSVMISCFDKTTGFVSGPVEFENSSNLFEKIQHLEFSSLILVGAGLIGIGSPIICNAANLGFRKSVFEKVGGYRDNINISSGDDEFLMQKIARETDYKVKFCSSKKAKSFTNPNKTLSEFYNQRKRWASKGFLYKDKRIVVKLVLIFLFYLGIPAQLLLGIYLNQIFLFSFFMSVFAKFFFEYRFMISASQKLFVKPKFSLFLLAELIHIPYIIIAGLTGLFGNYKWKGRKVKR